MKIKQFEIWTADLNPQIGTEPGKIRPVLVVQTNLLNDFHPSVIVCPITSNVILGSELLRVHLKTGQANLSQASDVMIDQLRAIDKKRLLRKVASLPLELRSKVIENIKIMLDIS